MKKYNLIYLRSGKMSLSKFKFESWMEIQDLHKDYIASLDFSSIDEVNNFLSVDFKIEYTAIEILTAKIHDVENDIELTI